MKSMDFEVEIKGWKVGLMDDRLYLNRLNQKEGGDTKGSELLIDITGKGTWEAGLTYRYIDHDERPLYKGTYEEVAKYIVKTYGVRVPSRKEIMDAIEKQFFGDMHRINE